MTARSVPAFVLQFDPALIQAHASRYSYRAEDRIVDEIGPTVRERASLLLARSHLFFVDAPAHPARRPDLDERWVSPWSLAVDVVVDGLPVIDHLFLSQRAGPQESTLGWVWGRRNDAGVGMSDHSGVAVDIRMRVGPA